LGIFGVWGRFVVRSRLTLETGATHPACADECVLAAPYVPSGQPAREESAVPAAASIGVERVRREVHLGSVSGVAAASIAACQATRSE